MTSAYLGLLVFCLVATGTVNGAKILMIPPDHHSNNNFFAVAGEAMLKAGHDVHFLTVPRHQALVDRHGLKGVYVHPQNYTHPAENRDILNKFLLGLSFVEKLRLMPVIRGAFEGLCHEMLQDGELEARITAERYDLAVVESMDFIRCLMVLPYRHGIPFVSLGVRHDPWSARVSASPSAEGFFALHPYADPYSPTLWERWSSVVLEMVIYVLSPHLAMGKGFIAQYAPEKPDITMRELYQQAELHFMNTETICLDTPRVSAPHYIFLGGIGTEPAKPLTGDFKAFADTAKDGLVLVTFGSLIKEIPMSRMNAMMAAFKQLPQRVVMRYDGPVLTDVPKNVMLSKWLPQNDPLGHPKTRLFITHGGANGQMEALYHGVPFVTIPLFAEQQYNAERGVARGFGTIVDFNSFTSEDLLSSIRQILDDLSYSSRIKDCARKYRAMPSPQKTLTFWVNHVIKHGSVHLKPTTLEMPMWRWFNLDILFICFILIHLNVHVARYTFKGIRFLLRKCKGTKSKSD